MISSDVRPSLAKPGRVYGNKLRFRNATTDDAAFILKLRTDAKKSAHLSKTSSDISAQVAWLERYATDHAQIYFIIEDDEGAPVGTVRLYDVQADSFCWGSWILQDGVPAGYAVESALIVYHFALERGFSRSHFDVRRDNRSVWQFHERFGAEKISESDDSFHYAISRDSIVRSLERYARFLPSGICVEYA